ncbi:outer membrane protein assembly factor BamB family protein [Leucobacter salsicius]|uniref:outer membrane protein assembly factor BamB family protein n=1 Tax=Leucobacter salsicius TaxID=664638 RepID=UPI00034D4A3D|nr:PQQ-binding-like beta-propeller repeat protein [Leucobacter salsicius]
MYGKVVDQQGEGIGSIAVSNGREVVLTSTTGEFSLELVTPFVHVSTPAGKRAQKSWVVATEDHELTFVLEECPQSLPFEFVHITDTHMTLPGVEQDDWGMYKEGALPQQIIDFLESLPTRAPDSQAVFITGDLVDNGLPEQFEEFRRVLTHSPVPTFAVPGNHDHMASGHETVLTRNNYLTNSGTPDLYEKHMGPRWYSFNVPGLHVVAMDWHSHELGIDHELQNAWLQEDLAAVPAGYPWLLLFHDQPGSSLLEHAPWQPVATLSGHWHTSRVVQVDETLHINTPAAFFGNLDYSPPAFRRIEWDGEAVQLHTELTTWDQTPGLIERLGGSTFRPLGERTHTNEPSATNWVADLAGAGHRQSISVHGEMLFAATQLEDEARGMIEAFDSDGGELKWSTTLSAAVKATPAVWNDVVVVADVSGATHGLDRSSGVMLWTVPSSDPLRRFAWNPPVVADGVAYLGDASDLRAIDVLTGEVVWRRTDLSPHHNLVNHAAPLVIGDLLVIGLWPTPEHPIGLDRRTGESVWSNPELGEDPFSSVKQLLMIGTAAADSSRGQAIIPAFNQTVVVRVADGTVAWSTPHSGGFSPGTPLVTPLGYIATIAGQGLRCLDPVSGDVIWELEIRGEAPFPVRSYTKVSDPTFAPPLFVDGLLVLPGLDGKVRLITGEGRLLGDVQFGAPFASEFVRSGDSLIGLDVTGSMRSISVRALLESVGCEKP